MEKPPKKKKKICKTVFLKNGVDSDKSWAYFYDLKENVEWEEGVRSKKGFTRKAKSLSFDETKGSPYLFPIICAAISKLTKVEYTIDGIYLNYYETGEMWTPNHSHKGTHQLIISLGGTRTLNVGKRSFEMENGDIILFGSSVHGVPKQPDKKQGRISIATFMTPISSL